MSKFIKIDRPDSTYDEVDDMLEKAKLDQMVRYVIQTTESKTALPVEIKLFTAHNKPETPNDLAVIFNETFYDKLSEQSQKEYLHRAISQIYVDDNGNVKLKKANLVDSFYRVSKVGMEVVEAAFHEVESIKQQMKDEAEAAKQAKEEARNAKKAAKEAAKASKSNRNPEF